MTTIESSKRPESLDELCDWIERHTAAIYLREQVDGRWTKVSLAELPPDRAIHHALHFIRLGRVPVIVLRDKQRNS